MRPITEHLPEISDLDLVQLGTYVESSGVANWPAFCNWLHPILRAESERRKIGGVVIADIKLPGDWSDLEAAEALEASFVLSYGENITEAMGRFLDSLAALCMVEASWRLGRKAAWFKSN